MAKTKTKTATKSNKPPKPTKTAKIRLDQERAAAVDKNIGKSRPLHELLAAIGWR
jgi:hypothetical protein